MANPFNSDDWDWPFILYVGRAWLRYTDEQTLNMTPKKFKSQLDAHRYVQDMLRGKESTVAEQPISFIDNIPGW